jgi:hypothetical protein
VPDCPLEDDWNRTKGVTTPALAPRARADTNEVSRPLVTSVSQLASCETETAAAPPPAAPMAAEPC